MTMQEMLALGAPELPGDLYYHVRSDSWAFFYVAIKQPRKWLWDKTLAEFTGKEYVRGENNELVRLSPKDAIRATAEQLHKSVFKTKPAERTWWDEFRTLEGDHK